jgi:hypothetical protein
MKKRRNAAMCMPGSHATIRILAALFVSLILGTHFPATPAFAQAFQGGPPSPNRVVLFEAFIRPT